MMQVLYGVNPRCDFILAFHDLPNVLRMNTIIHSQNVNLSPYLIGTTTCKSIACLKPGSAATTAGITLMVGAVLVT